MIKNKIKFLTTLMLFNVVAIAAISQHVPAPLTAEENKNYNAVVDRFKSGSLNSVSADEMSALYDRKALLKYEIAQRENRPLVSFFKQSLLMFSGVCGSVATGFGVKWYNYLANTYARALDYWSDEGWNVLTSETEGTQLHSEMLTWDCWQRTYNSKIETNPGYRNYARQILLRDSTWLTRYRAMFGLSKIITFCTASGLISAAAAYKLYMCHTYNSSRRKELITIYEIIEQIDLINQRYA